MARVISGNPAKVIKWVFSGVGAVIMAVGAVLLFVTADFMSNAEPVIGTVVSIDIVTNNQSRTYRPTIRFLDNTGQKRRAQTFLASTSYNFDTGEKLDIFYDTRDPSSIRLNSWFSLWGMGIIFAATGLITIITGQIIASALGRKLLATATGRPAQPRTAPEKSRKYAHVTQHDRTPPSVRRNTNPTVRRRR